MGTDKIGRNEPCSCGSGRKYKVCCYITEHNLMLTKGLNSLPLDTYFIRLTDNKEFYIHLDEHNADNYVYKVKKGLEGACGWSKVNGEKFINDSGKGNMELVKVLEVLGNDGTLN